MATTGKSLADGQLAASKATIYAVPALTGAYVTQIFLVNATAGAITINIYLKRSGSASRRIIEKDLSLAAGAKQRVCDNAQELRLSAGDVIEGDASAATSIDYFICGAEVT